MAIATDTRQETIKNYRRHDTDAGSPEVQIALLTERITQLTGHLQIHRHDYASRRGLLMMVSKRNGLLRYLVGKNRSRYQELIARLGLRK